MPSTSDTLAQQKLLRSHRDTLAILLRQQAQLGEAYAPPGVAHGIREARTAIRRIKAMLRDWGVECDDHPDDEPDVPASPASPATSFRAVKRAALEQRLADLTEEYNAVNAQISSELNTAHLIRLQRQLDDIERRIAQTEHELQSLPT
jgi:hypothetical protein